MSGARIHHSFSPFTVPVYLNYLRRRKGIQQHQGFYLFACGGNNSCPPLYLFCISNCDWKKHLLTKNVSVNVQNFMYMSMNTTEKKSIHVGVNWKVSVPKSFCCHCRKERPLVPKRYKWMKKKYKLYMCIPLLNYKMNAHSYILTYIGKTLTNRVKLVTNFIPFSKFLFGYSKECSMIMF